ncbi:MAG: hypothetical protein ABIJ08_01180, partial [Nanoarchaeota archaeon]
DHDPSIKDCDTQPTQPIESCTDEDNDGFCLPQDCNDEVNGIYPGAYDHPDDGVDADCDGKDTDGCSDIFCHPINPERCAEVRANSDNIPGFLSTNKDLLSEYECNNQPKDNSIPVNQDCADLEQDMNHNWINFIIKTDNELNNLVQNSKYAHIQDPKKDVGYAFSLSMVPGRGSLRQQETINDINHAIDYMALEIGKITGFDIPLQNIITDYLKGKGEEILLDLVDAGSTTQTPLGSINPSIVKGPGGSHELISSEDILNRLSIPIDLLFYSNVPEFPYGDLTASINKIPITKRMPDGSVITDNIYEYYIGVSMNDEEAEEMYNDFKMCVKRLFR